MRETDETSIDAKRLETVEAEIKAAGGDALSVAGDVGADDFPKKIVEATVRCAEHLIPVTIGLTEGFSKYGKINHIVNNGWFPILLLLFVRRPTTPQLASHLTRCYIPHQTMRLTLS